MNIITASDVKKFLTLAKIGFAHGKEKELKNYTSASVHEGTDVPKSYYVNIEFSFRIDPEHIDRAFAEENYDATKAINDLLKGL